MHIRNITVLKLSFMIMNNEVYEEILFNTMSRHLEAYLMTQFGLSMHVLRTLRSWGISHTLVAWCTKVVGLTSKSQEGLALPTVLWTSST